MYLVLICTFIVYINATKEPERADENQPVIRQTWLQLLVLIFVPCVHL